MPHANMAHWRSLITGEPIDPNYRAPRSVAELVDRRAKGSQIFEKLNVDLPDVAAAHGRVAMRPQPNSTPVGEIYVPHGTGPFPVLLHIHGGGWFAGKCCGRTQILHDHCDRWIRGGQYRLCTRARESVSARA